MQPIKALYIEIKRFLLQIKKKKLLNFKHSHSLVSYSLSIALKKTHSFTPTDTTYKIDFSFKFFRKANLIPTVFSRVARLTFKN